LEAEGIDKAGIVAKISRCLAERDIRINDLRSHTTPGADAGTPVYRLLMRISAPDATPGAAAELERALAASAEELRIDITLQRDD
jgi:glycine cleavage system regulatory protein